MPTAAAACTKGSGSSLGLPNWWRPGTPSQGPTLPLSACHRGRFQLSPVTGGLDEQGRLVSTYPERAKTANTRRASGVSVLVLSDDFDGARVQVDGEEHPDGDEDKQAMRGQGKSLLRITPTRWGPVATGGFPARLAADPSPTSG